MVAKKISILVLFMVCFSSCSKENGLIDSGKTVERGFFADEWKYVFNTSAPDQNAFRLWVPEGVIPKAVVVLAPGNASDGTNATNPQVGIASTIPAPIIVKNIFP